MNSDPTYQAAQVLIPQNIHELLGGRAACVQGSLLVAMHAGVLRSACLQVAANSSRQPLPVVARIVTVLCCRCSANKLAHLTHINGGNALLALCSQNKVFVNWLGGLPPHSMPPFLFA